MDSWSEIILGVLLVAVFVIFGALILMWLWNWLMPYLFGLPEINFWMALGIGVFASLLFGDGGSND